MYFSNSNFSSYYHQNKLKKLNKYFFIFIILSITTTNIYSQNKYSLGKCIDSALKNNYDLIYTAYQKNYNNAVIKTAWGAYLPSVNMNAGYSRTIGNTDNIISLNSYSLQLQSNLLLYDFGRREKNYQIANNNSKITDLHIKYMTEQLKLNVYSQFVNIIRLTEITKTRKEDIEVSKIQLDNLKARFDAGIIPIDPVLSQEAELGNKEIQLLQSEIEVNTAKQILLTTMGLNPTNEIDFDPANDIPDNISKNETISFRNTIGNLQNAINLALNNRLDYSTQKLNNENTKLSTDVANANYFPTLSASLGYGWHNNEIQSFDKSQGTLGVNLNIPIFNNFNTELQVQQAELNFQKENTTFLKLEQSIKAEVQTAYFNLEAAEKSIEIAEKSIIAAKRNYEAVKEKMNIGTATITDYITANTQYVAAQINKITATYIYLNSKRNLLFVIGKYE